jgi:hypothetical protein
MKRLLIIALFILGAVITAAQTLSASTLVTQAAPEQTAPATIEPETKPAEPVPALKAPEAKPAPMSQPAPAQAASAKQPHKDYAGMELKECATCHKGEGVAPTHGADWTREHRLFASKSEKNCEECHRQQFCLDCHTGGGIDADLRTSNVKMNYVPRSHRTDFREIHPLKALDNPQTCTRCHDARFCSACHAKFRGEDLRVLSHRKGWSDLRTAPLGPAHSTFTTAQCQTCHPGGLLPKHVWSSDHAREARRNLQACQTCHSDGAVCQTCHSARAGLKINPHPRNWSAVKDKYRSKSGGRSCIVCHDTY